MQELGAWAAGAVCGVSDTSSAVIAARGTPAVDGVIAHPTIRHALVAQEMGAGGAAGAQVGGASLA